MGASSNLPKRPTHPGQKTSRVDEPKLAEYQVPSRLSPPISKLETPIAPKLESDPDRIRSHSPVEESMSVKDRVNRMNLNETAKRESQLSPLSSRHVINLSALQRIGNKNLIIFRRHFQPRKTPIPPKPVISSPKRTTSPVVNPTTYVAVSNQVQNTSQRLDKEENSSSGKVSVQGLAKRFSSPIDNAPKEEVQFWMYIFMLESRISVA